MTSKPSASLLLLGIISFIAGIATERDGTFNHNGIVMAIGQQADIIGMMLMGIGIFLSIIFIHGTIIAKNERLRKVSFKVFLFSILMGLLSALPFWPKWERKAGVVFFLCAAGLAALQFDNDK